VVDYADRPFEDVRATLEQWAGTRLTSRMGQRPIARVGSTDRITDHVARVPMFEADAINGDPIAELRLIAVSTGHDALTEVLVFSDPGTATAAARAVAILRARSILEGAMRRLDTAPRRAG
jgi:hypothetical protein